MINKLIQSKNISDVIIYTVNEGNCLNLENYNTSILDFISDEKFKITKYFLEILKSKLNNYKNPLVIFYLYDLTLNAKDRSLEIKNRELTTINFLVKNGFPTIVCTENKVRQYNRNFYDTESIREEN